MAHGQVEGSVSAHGEAGDGSAGSVGNGGVSGVDVCNEFLGNEGFVAVFGSYWAVEVPAVACSVGHDNDEVVLVGQLSYCTVLCPYGVIAAMAVEQVDDRVGLLGAIPLGSYYGDKDVLIHTIALDGDFLLLEGKDARCEEQKGKEGNEFLGFHSEKLSSMYGGSALWFVFSVIWHVQMLS